MTDTVDVERIAENRALRITEDGTIRIVDSYTLPIVWTWCAIAGVARDTKLAVDTNQYGDGYIHRATRGLNPARPSWSLSFPFTSLDELGDMDGFLQRNAATGFWYTPEDAADGTQVFVCCDEWAATIEDRSGQGDRVGHLTATFVRVFNPQPGAPV